MEGEGGEGGRDKRRKGCVEGRGGNYVEETGGKSRGKRRNCGGN